MKTYRIAAIPGDGIGKEVVPEGIRVVDAAAKKGGFHIEWEVFPWSCEYYREKGKMMPDDGLRRIRNHDAIFLGAVGYPGVPDHISLWGLLIPIRRTFEQYANVRPVRLMTGIQSPLVGSNLFGDILSDLGPACAGTIAIAPSANLNPEREYPSMFEPVHGSAPDIAGRNTANPIGQIWSGAMMLEHLGETDAANAIVRAIESALQSGTKTRDIGGSASTDEVGKAIAQAVESGV